MRSIAVTRAHVTNPLGPYYHHILRAFWRRNERLSTILFFRLPRRNALPFGMRASLRESGLNCMDRSGKMPRTLPLASADHEMRRAIFLSLICVGQWTCTFRRISLERTSNPTGSPLPLANSYRCWACTGRRMKLWTEHGLPLLFVVWIGVWQGCCVHCADCVKMRDPRSDVSTKKDQPIRSSTLDNTAHLKRR